MRAVVPPFETWPAPGVARPLDGAVVAVVPDGAVVAGVVVADAAVVGVAVVGVWKPVVGAAADVAGVDPPPTGGWVSGTVVGDAVLAPGRMVVVLMSVGGTVVGAAVVVFVVSSPLRTTTVAMPAPRTPRISTASAMPRSRLRWVPPELFAGLLPPSALCRVPQVHTWTPRGIGERCRAGILRWPRHPAGVAQW